VKTFLYMMCAGLVIGMAYWAYRENYRTQATLRRVAALQAAIATEREAISVLSAEWAYLNRPDRLRELVEMNFADLGLLPLMPQHFADVELVAYPQKAILPTGGTPPGPDRKFP